MFCLWSLDHGIVFECGRRCHIKIAGLLAQKKNMADPSCPDPPNGGEPPVCESGLNMFGYSEFYIVWIKGLNQFIPPTFKTWARLDYDFGFWILDFGLILDF